MVKNTKCKELFPKCLCNTCRRREMDHGYTMKAEVKN